MREKSLLVNSHKMFNPGGRNVMCVCLYQKSVFKVYHTEVVYCSFIHYTVREGVQRRHDPRKNDLLTSGFAELPPGPAKLVSQPQ